MPFLVLGYDGDDDEALNRRLAVREEHVKLGNKLRDDGKVLYSSPMNFSGKDVKISRDAS